jgi:glycosyltransferase involved in cell wall biosynthesis
MKNLLMISYFFPPQGGPGVQRVMYFARDLPDLGYRPVVLHGDGRPAGMPRDESLLGELPTGLRQYRFGQFEPGCLLHPVIRRLERFGRVGKALSWRVGALCRRIEHGLSPDELVLWARHVLPAAMHLVELEDIDAIYSTSDPYSNHYLAWLLKRRTGLPWLADFRDLWTTDKLYQRRRLPSYLSDRRFERAFLRDADAVATVSQGYAQALSSLAGGRRVEVVRNGVDLAGTVAGRYRPGTTFVLRMVGTLYDDQWSDALCTAVSRLAGQRGEAFRFRLQMVGRANARYAMAARRLGEFFEHHPYVPHNEARRLMASADALLLLVNRGRNAEGVVPAKLYEYMASGRPVLCLSPTEGETARLLRRHRAGLVARSDSVDEIRRALASLYDEWAAGRPRSGADAGDLGAYDRRELARQMALLLNTCLARRHAAAGERRVA